MKLIKPSFEIIVQKAGYQGIIEKVEKAGRIAYKSEDRITEDSAQPFVNMLIKKGHTSVLEHGTVYLKLSNSLEDMGNVIKYGQNNYSVVSFGDKINYYITTNYRVLVQNNWEKDLEFLCEPTEYHEKRFTVKFIIDRGISHEFVRHRTFSFTQESSRYCNYSKGKFDNEITFIIPNWLSYEEQQFTNKDDSSIRTDLSENEYFIDCLLESERTYNYLVKYCNWKPQQARAVLPNSLKTELVMTGTSTQWRDFLSQRTASTAHPQATEIAIPLQAQLQFLNLI